MSKLELAHYLHRRSDCVRLGSAHALDGITLETVKHSKGEYKRGIVYTNNIESRMGGFEAVDQLVHGTTLSSEAFSPIRQ